VTVEISGAGVNFLEFLEDGSSRCRVLVRDRDMQQCGDPVLSEVFTVCTSCDDSNRHALCPFHLDELLHGVITCAWCGGQMRELD
jgi:hypothetical protein